MGAHLPTASYLEPTSTCALQAPSEKKLGLCTVASAARPQLSKQLAVSKSWCPPSTVGTRAGLSGMRLF